MIFNPIDGLNGSSNKARSEIEFQVKCRVQSGKQFNIIRVRYRHSSGVQSQEPDSNIEATKTIEIKILISHVVVIVVIRFTNDRTIDGGKPIYLYKTI